jgi:uncharacterized protein
MSSNAGYTVEIVDSLECVAESDWNELAGPNPFVGYRFLRLLEHSGCVAPDTGWYPQYLLLRRDGGLAAVAPAYLKTHSRGEFVFDQAWAQAFEQHGLQYYPKLLVASPFSPVQGPRLLAKDKEARVALAEAVLALCRATSASSVHVLFIEDADRDALVNAGYMVREGVQFHWVNEGYTSADEFLSRLSHDKRKKVRQDGKYVAAAGITYRWLEGKELTNDYLDFFYACYAKTYSEHWSRPYLTQEFFQRAHADRALKFVLVLAEREGAPLACALNVFGDNVLYGRYWGTSEFVRGLHFETCYMQSIRYCIENGVRMFEGGAQGEHKMSRGLMPVKTYSAHHVADRRFAAAIEDFLQRETSSVDRYVDELEASSPFKQA